MGDIHSPKVPFEQIHEAQPADCTPTVKSRDVCCDRSVVERLLTESGQRRQLGGAHLRRGIGPGTRLPHRLQTLLLDVLQLDGDAPVTRLPQLEPHPPSRVAGGQGGRVHHRGGGVQSAQVPEAAPAAVQGHLYSTVVVGGAAEWRRLTAT